MPQSGRLDSTDVTRPPIIAAVSFLFFAFACSNGANEALPPDTGATASAPTTQPSPTPVATPTEEALIDTPNSAATTGEIKVPEMPGRRHLERADEPHELYNSVPATSGPHFSVWWRDWGVVNEELPDELVVHNMEHGGVIIRYDCPIGCPALVSQLADVTLRYQKVILSPYSNLGTRIALTAWTYLDKFDEFDEGRIVLFIETHMNSPESPEPLVFP